MGLRYRFLHLQKNNIYYNKYVHLFIFYVFQFQLCHDGQSAFFEVGTSSFSN